MTECVDFDVFLSKNVMERHRDIYIDLCELNIVCYYLSLGLYLLVQTNTVKTFTIAPPFFIAVGTIDDEGKPVYDIDASPKAGIGGGIPDPPDFPLYKLWYTCLPIMNVITRD